MNYSLVVRKLLTYLEQHESLRSRKKNRLHTLFQITQLLCYTGLQWLHHRKRDSITGQVSIIRGSHPVVNQ